MEIVQKGRRGLNVCQSYLAWSMRSTECIDFIKQLSADGMAASQRNEVIALIRFPDDVINEQSTLDEYVNRAMQC